MPNDCQQNRQLSNKNLFTLPFEPNLITKIKQAIRKKNLNCKIWKFWVIFKKEIKILCRSENENFQVKKKKKKRKEKKSLQGIGGGQIEEECEWV